MTAAERQAAIDEAVEKCAGLVRAGIACEISAVGGLAMLTVQLGLVTATASGLADIIAREIDAAPRDLVDEMLDGVAAAQRIVRISRDMHREIKTLDTVMHCPGQVSAIVNAAASLGLRETPG